MSEKEIVRRSEVNARPIATYSLAPVFPCSSPAALHFLYYVCCDFNLPDKLLNEKNVYAGYRRNETEVILTFYYISQIVRAL